MLVVTTENVAGHRVVEVKGQCFGVVVRSRGLGGNVMAAALLACAIGALAGPRSRSRLLGGCGLNIHRIAQLVPRIGDAPPDRGTHTPAERGGRVRGNRAAADPTVAEIVELGQTARQKRPGGRA
jgi:hypothetical protein